jgi:hypothetical protein
MNGKKIFGFLLFKTLLAVIIISPASFSQMSGEVSLLYGYQMLGTVEVYSGLNSGDFDINDAAYYGAVLGFRAEREVMFEFQYVYQPTKASFDDYGSDPEIELSNIDVHYIMLGAMYEKPFSRTTFGYGGLLIGTSGIVPDKNFESEWRLAFGLTLGAKFMISEKIGLKIQAQGLFPVQWSGGNFYVGTGGTDYSITAGTSITQINVGGGLFYAF